MFAVPYTQAEGRASLETLASFRERAALKSLLKTQLKELGDDVEMLFGGGCDMEKVTLPNTIRPLPVSLARVVPDEKALTGSSLLDKLSKEMEREIAQGRGQPPPLKKSKTKKQTPQALSVEHWSSEWMAHGKSGSIGLVPECVQQLFPEKHAQAQLTPRERNLIEHFAVWQKK